MSRRSPCASTPPRGLLPVVFLLVPLLAGSLALRARAEDRPETLRISLSGALVRGVPAALLPAGVADFGAGLSVPVDEIRIFLALREAAHRTDPADHDAVWLDFEPDEWSSLERAEPAIARIDRDRQRRLPGKGEGALRFANTEIGYSRRQRPRVLHYERELLGLGYLERRENDRCVGRPERDRSGRRNVREPELWSEALPG